MNAFRGLWQLRVDARGERVHQLGPGLVADPQRCPALLAVIPVGRAFPPIDRRVPHADRLFAAYFKSVSYPHDVNCISAAARALAADRAIAALIGVGRVAVDREADRTAAARAFETHRHSSLLGERFDHAN